MANVCFNIITVSVTEGCLEETFDKFVNDLNNQSAILINKCPYFKKGNYYGVDYMDDIDNIEDEYHFNISSKWSPPLDEIEAISIMYPGINFHVRWEEGGNDVYGYADICNGNTNTVDLECIDYYSAFDSTFKEGKKILQEGSWEEIKDYPFSFDFGYPYDTLELEFVKHIPFEELPVWIGHDWVNPESKEEFNKKLLKGK